MGLGLFGGGGHYLFLLEMHAFLAIRDDIEVGLQWVLIIRRGNTLAVE